MWNYQKIDLIQPVSVHKYIAFIGSGGKTTLMEYLAVELVKLGKTVAITTTTKIYAKEPYFLMGECPDEKMSLPFVRVGGAVEDGKLTAVGFKDVEKLGGLYDVVFVEADGARGQPLKFPAIHEPVIPPFSEKVFAICGLDGLSRRINEAVFRWELFQEATGMDGDALVTPQVFLRFFSDDALLKGLDRKRCTVVLNKYDVPGVKKEAIEIGKEVIAGTGIEEVIVSSVLYKVFYGIKHQRPEVGSLESEKNFP